MESAILEELRKGNLDDGGIAEKLKTVLSRTHSGGDQVSRFPSQVLTVLARRLIDTKDAMSTRQLKELRCVLNESCKYITDRYENVDSVDRSLYHVFSNMMRLGLVDDVLMFSPYLISLVEREIDGNLANLSKTLCNTLKNCYLMFWNYASASNPTDQNREICLRVCVEALKYLYYCERDVKEIISRALKAVFTFETNLNEFSTTRLNYFQELNQLIVKSIHACQDIRSTEVAGVLLVLHKWNVTFSNIHREQEYNPKIAWIFLQSGLVLQKIKRDVALENSSCVTCFELLTSVYELFDNFHNKSLCETLVQRSVNLEKIFTKSFISEHKDAFHFALLVLKFIQTFVIKQVESSQLRVNNEEQFLCLISTYYLYFHLLTMEAEMEESLWLNPIVKNSVMRSSSFQNMFCLFVSVFTQNEHLISIVISHAVKVLKEYGNIIECLEITNENYANIGLILGNMGIVCYRKSLFREAVIFLKECISVLRKWCLAQEDKESQKQRQLKVNLENKYLLLFICLRKLERFEDCLEHLVTAIQTFVDIPSEIMNYWILVKNELALESKKDLKTRTVRHVVEKKSKAEAFELLRLELNAYKTLKCSMHEEIFYVIKEMLEVAPGSLEYATAMLELTKNQWRRPIENERSALTCCMEAKSVLENYLAVTLKRSDEAQNLYATIHFWQYLTELQVFQSAVRLELTKPIVKPEPKCTDEEELNNLYDEVPNYSYISIDREKQNLNSLDKALELWDEFRAKYSFNSLLEPYQTVNDIMAAAEIYTLARQENQEFRAWKLALNFAEATKSYASYVICSTRLVNVYCRQGNIKKAKLILKRSAKISEHLHCPSTTEEEYASLKQSLAEVQILLYEKEVTNGLKILTKLWWDPFLQKKSRWAKLIIGEIRILASQFVILPSSFWSNEALILHKPWENSNALELAIQGINCYLSLAKLVVKEADETDHSLPFAHHIVSSLMNANSIMVQMFTNIGSPREARWFLKEQLTVGVRLALGIRSCESLLGLAKLDLMCDNFTDCQVKIYRVQLIVQSTTDSVNEDAEKITDASLDRIDFRYLSKLGVCAFEFLSHPISCQCWKCENPILSQLAIDALNLQANGLALNNSVGDAVAVARLTLKITEKKEKNVVNRMLAMSENYLEISRFLRLEKKFLEAMHVAEKGIKCLSSSPCFHIKMTIMLPHLLYQKGICALNMICEKEKKSFVDLVSPFWTISDGKLRLEHLIEKLSLEENPCTTNILKTIRRGRRNEASEMKTDFSSIPDASLQKLVQAPERKNRKIVLQKRQPFLEPSDDSDEEKEKDGINTKIGLKNPQIKSSAKRNATKICDETDSKKEVKSKRTDNSYINLSIVQNLNEAFCASENESLNDANEVVEVKKPEILESSRVTRSRTKGSKENDSAVINLTNTEDTNTTVEEKPKTRSNRSKSRLKKLEEEITKGMRKTRRRGGKEDDAEQCREDSWNSDSNAAVFFDIEEEELEKSSVLENQVEPVEIPRSGRVKNDNDEGKQKEKIEDREILRHLGRNDEFDNIDYFSRIDQGRSSPKENGVTLQSAMAYLERAFDLIKHHPICPLYSDLCLMLALFKGRQHPSCSYFLSESVFVTLRHHYIITAGKKINRISQNDNVEMNEAERENSLRRYHQTIRFNQNLGRSKKYKVERHLNSLPEDWCVCQLVTIPSIAPNEERRANKHLLISRFEKNLDPVNMKVPTICELNEMARSLLEEFSDILEQSRETMKNSDRVIWWDSRRNLDSRMKTFTSELENVWLGHWKGLLLGKPVSKVDKKRLEKTVREILHIMPSNCQIDPHLVEIFFDSVPWLNEHQLKQGIIEIIGFEDESLVSQLVEQMKYKSSMIKNSEMKRQPVVLILGKEIERLPWENIPILRNHSVSRMPSLSLLDAHISWQRNQDCSVFLQGVNPKKTYFILNPSNDLAKTQETFEKWFVNKEKWEGVIGRPPTEEEFSKGLSGHDLFIYCGHGSGGKYLSGEAIQRLFCSAVVLLMGCSSGKLRALGQQLEPSGAVFHYLFAGCPCVVADLWDVTDRDIDRFLEGLLGAWTKSKDGLLTSVLQTARTGCRLPFLIGCAPVVYGVPVPINV